MITSGQYNRGTRPPPGAILNVCHPLASGLGYYWLFNEGTGVPMSLRESTLAKRIPQANQAGGAGTWVPGGLYINNGGLKGPRFHGCNWTDNCTLAIHLTIDSVTGIVPGLVSKRNASGATGWNLHIYDGSIWLQTGSSNFKEFAGADPGLNGLGEHLIVVTYDAGDTATEWRCYVDGRQVATINDATRPGFYADSVFVNVGVRWPGDTTYATGTIHSLGFWVYTALGAGAVAQLWQNPYAMFVWPGVMPQMASGLEALYTQGPYVIAARDAWAPGATEGEIFQAGVVAGMGN